MAAARQSAVELRPGVERPDWSAATSPAAQQALLDRAGSRLGLIDRWRLALTADEDRVWRAVIELYASLGQAPRVAEIGVHAELPDDVVPELLRRLEERDLLSLGAGETVRHAYPFT